MKEISKGNKQVIEKQEQEKERQEQEVNHEYETGKMNALNSVIKQGLAAGENTKEAHEKKFIVTEEQKKAIDQVVFLILVV